MRLVLGALLLTVLFGSRAFASEALPRPAPCGAAPVVAAVPQGDPCCLTCPRWTVTPGLWLFGVEGSVGANGRVAAADSDWTDALDLVDKLEFALNARVRAEWRRWTATVQVDGVTLEDSVTFREGGRGITGELGLWFVQADLGYKFAGGALGCTPCSPTFCLEAYAGLRAGLLSLELGSTSPAVNNAVDEDITWVDPIVGLRAHLALSRSFDLVLEGDIGGFGVSSDFTWNVLAAARWNLSRTFGLVAGWRVLDVDYQDGGDVFDAQLSGPLAGLSITF